MTIMMVFQPRRVVLAAIAALSLGAAVPAQAQMFGGRIVFDPSNFSQNI